MKNQIIYFLLFFVLCIQNPAVAQYEVTKYDVSNGLMHENVLGVWQDKEGYIWVADEMGFSRINGDEIINYWLPDGLRFDYSFVFKKNETGFEFNNINIQGKFVNMKYEYVINEESKPKYIEFTFLYKYKKDTIQQTVMTINKFNNKGVKIVLLRNEVKNVILNKGEDSIYLTDYNVNVFKPNFIDIDYLKFNNSEYFKNRKIDKNIKIRSLYISKIIKEKDYTYFLKDDGRIISVDTNLQVKELFFEKYRYIRSIHRDAYENYYIKLQSSKEILYVKPDGSLIHKIELDNFNNGRSKFYKVMTDSYFIDRENNKIYSFEKGKKKLILEANRINNIKIIENKLYCIDNFEGDLIIYEIINKRVTKIFSQKLQLNKWVSLYLIDKEGCFWLKNNSQVIKLEKTKTIKFYSKQGESLKGVLYYNKQTYRFKDKVLQIIETENDTTFIFTNGKILPINKYQFKVLGRINDSILLITSRLKNIYKLGFLSIKKPDKIDYIGESIKECYYERGILVKDDFLYKINDYELQLIDSSKLNSKYIYIQPNYDLNSNLVLHISEINPNEFVFNLKINNKEIIISKAENIYSSGFVYDSKVYIFQPDSILKYDFNGKLIESIQFKDKYRLNYSNIRKIGNCIYYKNSLSQLMEYNLFTNSISNLNNKFGLRHVTDFDIINDKIILLSGESVIEIVKINNLWGLNYLFKLSDLINKENIGFSDGFWVSEDEMFVYINYNNSIYTYNKNFKAPFTTLNTKFRTINYYNSEKVLIETDTNLVGENKFSHMHKNLSIRMETITNFHAETVVYHYQLIGSETDKWFETKTDSVMFSNLSAGTYTFNFWSENGFDVKSETKSYSFIILPPWYNTWWARILYVLIGGLLVFGFVRSRTAKLKKRQTELEYEVELATVEIKEQKQEVEQQRDKAEHEHKKAEELRVVAENQKELVEEKNKEILDSITYAKRIQNAILPPPRLVKEWLNDSFIFYKPKDIVAGDFYWMEVVKRDGRNIIFYAAADCTGHGVPGAMVSVVCSNALNRSVKEFNITDPAKLLDKVTELVKNSFEQSEEAIKDGMDIAICALDLVDRKVWFAGAHNPLYRITDLDTKVSDDLRILEIENRKLVEYKADKQPVGEFEYLKPFTTTEIQLEPGDCIYIFSDGFSDQFGGEKNKKYKSANFKKFLMHIESKDMDAQKEMLDVEINRWRGEIEQLDDICVIGLRVNGHMRKIFTNRELEIMEKVIGGKTSKIIGEELFISKHTVDTHRKRIMAKSNSKNATELIVFCKHHEIGF